MYAIRNKLVTRIKEYAGKFLVHQSHFVCGDGGGARPTMLYVLMWVDLTC